MPLQQVAYPDINGKRYDMSSVEIFVPGYPSTPPQGGILGCESIDYDDGLEGGELRGSAPYKLADTTGKYTAAGSITLPKLESENFLSALAIAGLASVPSQGYLQSALVVIVSYFDIGQPLITDRLFGLRLKKVADSHKSGQDPLKAKHDFTLFMIQRNGKFPFNPDVLAAVFGSAYSI